MPISESKLQCTAILKKSVVEVIDVLAEESLRSRSTQIAYILHEYLREHSLMPEDED